MFGVRLDCSGDVTQSIMFGLRDGHQQFRAVTGRAYLGPASISFRPTRAVECIDPHRRNGLGRRFPNTVRDYLRIAVECW